MKFFIFSLIITTVTGVELPPDMKVCYRNAPNTERNQCLKETIAKLIPVLKNGFSPLKIPPIDPYVHGRSHFEYKQGILTVTQNLKNVVIYGISDMQILDVRTKANDRNFYIEFDTMSPRLTILGDYKGNAVLSELIVKSGGKINITSVDVTSTYKLLGKVNKTIGDDFITFTGFDLTNVDAKQMFINATGLFPDPDVNNFAVEFINQTWRYLFDQLVPEIKKIWGPVCVKVANSFFEQIPYSQLLPKK